MALQLLEGSVSYSKPAEVDAVSGIIKGVKFCGIESQNGRRYPKEVLARELAKYDGAPVYFSHSDTDRDFFEQAGWGRNPEIRADGVYGNIDCLTKSPHVPMFLEAAAKMVANPGARGLGMSHSASGDGHYDGDTLVVDKIEEVFSIDIVTRPATTKGLFESRGGNVTKTIKLKALLERIEPKFKGNRPKWLKKLREDDAMAPAMAADVPDAEDGASAEDMLKKGFRGAITKILDDESLDIQGKISQIKDILKTEEKMLQKDEPAAPADTPTDSSSSETPKTEGVRRSAGEANLQERLDKHDRKDRLTEYAESLSFAVPRELWPDLLDMKEDAAKRTILRESNVKAAPRSGGPGSTRTDADTPAPKTVKEFKEAIFSRN